MQRHSKRAYVLSTFAGIWRPMGIFSCVKKLFGNRRITMTSMGYDTVAAIIHIMLTSIRRMCIVCFTLKASSSGGDIQMVWYGRFVCLLHAVLSHSHLQFARLHSDNFSMTLPICRIYNIPNSELAHTLFLSSPRRGSLCHFWWSSFNISMVRCVYVFLFLFIFFSPFIIVVQLTLAARTVVSFNICCFIQMNVYFSPSCCMNCYIYVDLHDGYF